MEQNSAIGAPRKLSPAMNHSLIDCLPIREAFVTVLYRDDKQVNLRFNFILDKGAQLPKKVSLAFSAAETTVFNGVFDLYHFPATGDDTAQTQTVILHGQPSCEIRNIHTKIAFLCGEKKSVFSLCA